MLRLGLLLLVLVATLGVAPAAAGELPPGGTFVDDDGNVHEGYIEAIAAEGVTRGCGGDRYCPDDAVTRGEMAAFIRRALRLPGSSSNHFNDDGGHLFEDDIDALAAAGITKGCGDGSGFCPERAVTRGEMAAFLSRAKGLAPSSADHFSDDDASMFESEIDAIAVDGITAGCNPPDNTRFCPRETTTRDQMASFLGRFLELAPRTPPARPTTELSVEDAIRRWFPSNHGEAIAVARCESSLNPRAVNPRGYHGLFQIGETYHRSSFERVTGERWNDAIYTAYHNAQYAKHLYDQSGSWSAWGCKP